MSAGPGDGPPRRLGVSASEVEAATLGSMTDEPMTEAEIDAIVAELAQAVLDHRARCGWQGDVDPHRRGRPRRVDVGHEGDAAGEVLAALLDKRDL